MKRYFCVLATVALAFAASAQPRPYIGFAYPAGGQQGTTFQVKIGGQGLDGAQGAVVSGSGVTSRLVEYQRVLNNQEVTLLNEQLRELKKTGKKTGSDMMAATPMMASDTMMSDGAPKRDSAGAHPGSGPDLVSRIEKRTSHFVNRPASAALASIAYLEITVAPDAQPGERELRLTTSRGVSNPLAFHVGQYPEFSRKAMTTASFQVLGKEQQALRKRPPEEKEQRVSLPCTVNGQIASGEMNTYRFEARKGQRLVVTTLARQLIPYIADAVPGWFQPVIALYDAAGREVAYDDDYQFHPDPALFYEVPRDGDYVLAVYDAIYRGREDFVYRITLGEQPFVRSVFPLGARTNAPVNPKLAGWNLDQHETLAPKGTAVSGVHAIRASRAGRLSNPRPFAVDSLPETMDKESNNTIAKAQAIDLPVVVNGLMNSPGDWDVFKFTGKSNDTVVVEVSARRLESPLDSIVKLTDAKGRLLAFNDDCEDLGCGLNTHDADSYLSASLPNDGTYYVHLGDTARNAGEEYAYRLRLSTPQPDFALRAVPSSLSLRSKGTATLNVHILRKDGFTGPVKLTLKDPPNGFSASPVTLTGTQTVARLNIKTTLASTDTPVNLAVVGTAKIDGQDIARDAVPAEDRMQAFFWKHLVTAADLPVLVYDPAYQPPPRKVAPSVKPGDASPTAVVAAATADNKPKFSKQQVAGRLRQLKYLYEEDLLTDAFYREKVAECEAATQQ